MRADVKLGMVSSAVIVLLAGGYYIWQSPGHEPIKVAESGSVAAPSTRTAATNPASKRQAVPPRATPRSAGRAAKGTVRPANRRAAKTIRNTAGPGSRTPRALPSPAPNFSARRAKRRQEPAVSAPPLVSRNTTNRPAAHRSDYVPASRAGARRGSGTTGVTANRTTGSARNTSLANRIQPGVRNKPAVRTQDPQRSKDAAVRNTTRARTAPPKGTRMARTLAATPSTSRNEGTAAVETHVIQPGDSLAAIARRYYGSERYTDFLIKSNPQLSDPRRLKIGATVRIPARPDDRDRARTSSPGTTRQGKRSAASTAGTGRTYRVRPGDSFYAIARDRLGDASRWRELFELNKALVNGDPTSLRAGQTIALPGK